MRIGDNVLVIDDDISGVISKIDTKITIKTSEGFELMYDEKELVVVDGTLSKGELAQMNLDTILKEKLQTKKNNSKKIKRKERSQPVYEVDLHIHQLIPKTKNLSNFDMLNIQLDEAKRRLEYAIANRIHRVVFIHGVGEGVLRTELEYLFNRYDNLKFYDADYQKYGRGATEVYIFQNPK